MLEKVIRDFCRENNYEILEKYETHTMFNDPVTTLAIVVKPDHNNVFDVLAQLTSYLETKEFDDLLFGQITDELEGYNIAEIGSNLLIYFPYIRDYQPLPPNE